MPKLLGKAPNQVPTNADLGTMAFQDREGINVNNAIVANLVVTGATSVNATFAVVNTTANVLFVAANGNVGIQTNAPAFPLHIYSNNASLGAFNTTGGTNLIIDSPSAQAAAVLFRQGGGNALFFGTKASNTTVLRIGESSTGQERFTFFANSTAGSARMGINNTAPTDTLSVNGSFQVTNTTASAFFVAANGNIGIGNSAPVEKLSIEGSFMSLSANDASPRIQILQRGNTTTSRFPQFVAVHYSGNTAAGDSGGFSVVELIRQRGTLSAPSAVLSGDILGGFNTWGSNTTGSQLAATRIQGIAEANFTTTATAGIQFITVNAGAGSEKVRIGANGNVGINNAAPTDMLSVNGTVQFTNSTASVLFAAANGNVGLGITAPTSRLHVSGNFRSVVSSQGDFTINHAGLVSTAGAVAGVQLALQGGGVEAIRIDTGANVGIGNTTPNAKLQVTGTANISGNVAFGQDVTIAGNLTVSGTRTYVNTTTLDVGDNIITLNADVSGVTAPTENAGIEINRGSSANAQFIWDETSDEWDSMIGGTAKFAVSNTQVNVTGNTFLRLSSYNSEGGELLFANSTNGSGPIIDVDGSNNWRFNTYNNASHINFGVGATPTSSLFLAANGNVGVGSITPATKMFIAGTTYSNGQITAMAVYANGSGGSTFRANTPGLAQGERSAIAFHSTFMGSADNGPRRTADIFAGFNNGTWGNEYLAIGVGFGGTPNDNANTTNEAIRVVANGNIGIGNTTPAHKLRIESGVLSLGNSTSNVQITIPTSVQASATNFWLNANGQWSQITGIAATGQGTNGAIQYNDSGATNGSDGFRFNSASNTVIIGNSTVNTTLTSTTASFNVNATATAFFIAANGNIGIANTAPTEKLVVNGNILANNLRRFTATRTLSVTANDTVEIGTLSSTHGAHSLDITIQCTDSGFSVAKQYRIVSMFNATGSTVYRRVLPSHDTGPFSSNDFDLEAYHNNETIGLRVRRTGGSTSGTLEIVIEDMALATEGIGSDSFTPSTTTATGVAAVTDIFPGSRLLQTGINAAVSNAFVVVANTTVNAITSNNTITAFNLPVTFNNVVAIGNITTASLGLVTSATTANQVLFTSAAAGFRTTKYLVQITSGSVYQATEIVLIHDGTNVYKSEYGQVFSGAVLATFDADINSGNVRLLTTPTNAVTTYKGSVSLVPV